MEVDVVTRPELLKLISKALRRREAHDSLAVQAEDGSRPIVPALFSDGVRDVTKKVAQLGGVANVILATQGGLACIGFTGIRGRSAQASDQFVHKDISMGMLWEYLQVAGDHTVISVSMSDAHEPAMFASAPHAILVPAN